MPLEHAVWHEDYMAAYKILRLLDEPKYITSNDTMINVGWLNCKKVEYTYIQQQ